MAGNELSLSGLGIQMPYNMQAEQSVLGAALMDENILTQLITELEPEMFYSDQNRAVYAQMAALFAENEAVDVVTLVDALASSDAAWRRRFRPCPMWIPTSALCGKNTRPAA